MKITELLKNNRDRVTFSFEFIPPKKGFYASQLIEKLAPLMEYKPLFVDITTHRNEIVFDTVSPHRGESIRGFVHKKHLSPLAVCEAVRTAFNVEVMPHLLCCGFDKTETEDILLDLNFLGYSNVMALRGDKLPTEHSYPTIKGLNNRSSDLINQIYDLNQGIALDSTLSDIKTDFCIAAAAYPERYSGSPSLEYDLLCYNTLKSKADILVSQMCFDNKPFYEFCKNLPNATVIPGIKVLSRESQISTVPEHFNVSIPEELRKDLNETSGVEWAVYQCRDLIEHGYKHLHFYTMNSSLVCKVLNKLL